MTVDSYAFLPRAFRAMFEAEPHRDADPVWAEVTRPISSSRVGLLSSAGLFLAGDQEPYDVERERREPTWGDPTMRVIPHGVAQSALDARHLHINTRDLLIDVDVSLPVNRLGELAAAGIVSDAAPEHYSVMGYQQEGLVAWRTETGPEIAARCRAAEIDVLVLAPA